jgi:hypothetical protein
MPTTLTVVRRVGLQRRFVRVADNSPPASQDSLESNCDAVAVVDQGDGAALSREALAQFPIAIASD